MEKETSNPLLMVPNCGKQKQKQNKITEKSYLFSKMQEKKNFTSEKPPEKNHHIKTQVEHFERPNYP